MGTPKDFRVTNDGNIPAISSREACWEVPVIYFWLGIDFIPK